MDLQIQLDQAQKHLMQRYLNAVFRSLSQPVEIVLRDGRKADGIFDGFLPQTSTFQIKNFCLFQEENFEPKIQLQLSQVRFIRVKNTTAQNLINASVKTTPINLPTETITLPTNKPQNEIIPPKKDPKFLNDEYDFPKKLHQKKELEKSYELQKSTQPKKEAPNLKTGIKNQVFQTDAEIPKTKPAKNNKTFQKFEVQKNFPVSNLMDEKLEKFDQFATNKKCFNIGAEFDENEYSTFLDVTSVPATLRLKAEKLEAEIKHSSLPADPRHLLEERGLVQLQDNDNEEAIYSSVSQLPSVPETPSLNLPENNKEEKSPNRENVFKLKPLKTQNQTLLFFRKNLEENFQISNLKNSERIESLSIGSNGPVNKNQVPSVNNSDFSHTFASNFLRNDEDAKRRNSHFKHVGLLA